MRTCVICGRKVNLVFSRKTSDGHICKNCRRYIPKSVKLSVSETDYLKRLLEGNQEKKKIFDATAHLGSLYIDSLHGMLCISKKGYKDKPCEFHDIYYVTELTDAGLYISDVRNIGTQTNIIACNVKFKIVTKDVSSEYIIISNKRCPFKVVGSQVECSEPADVSMFRNMFNQMIDDVAFAMSQKLKMIQQAEALASEYEKNNKWAKGVLFIDEEVQVSSALLKERRNTLVRIFHPDMQTGFENEEIMAQINKAYELLKE